MLAGSRQTCVHLFWDRAYSCVGLESHAWKGFRLQRIRARLSLDRLSLDPSSGPLAICSSRPEIGPAPNRLLTQHQTACLTSTKPIAYPAPNRLLTQHQTACLTSTKPIAYPAPNRLHPKNDSFAQEMGQLSHGNSAGIPKISQASNSLG